MTARSMEAEGDSLEETATERTERGSRLLFKRKRLSYVPDKLQQLRRFSGAASDEDSGHVAFETRSPSKSGRGFGTRKRKRGGRILDQEVMKPELDADQELDAAQALFELLGGGGGGSVAIMTPEATTIHWTGKKTRSNRSTKSSCAYKSRASITVSSQILPPPSVDLFSSSTAAAPVEVVVDREVMMIDTVKQEEGLDVPSDGKSGTGTLSAVDIVDPVEWQQQQQQLKLVSESSLESMQLNSRAASPSSPLPVFRADANNDVPAPKATPSSAFAQVMPPIQQQQPLKKLSIFRKPKIEDALPESYQMPVKEEWKQATRGGRNPSWISSETGSQVMASSRAEGYGIQQGPAVFLNGFSNSSRNVKTGEGNHLKLHSATGLKQEENKVDSSGSSRLKVEEEIRQKRQKLSASTQGRTALSEVEREARRLHRIQANRESARQTIRKKQVLCEELGQRAAALLAEKEDLQQRVQRQTAEYRLLLEMNMRLKGQVALQADNKELTQASSSSRLSSSAAAVMPMSPSLSGLRLPPFCWALALAQGAAAGQALVEQTVGRALGLQQQHPMLLAAAAMAATATFNNGIRLPSLRMGKPGGGGGNIASTSSLVPKPATKSVVDKQRSPTTVSIAVPSLPPAPARSEVLLPEKNRVSVAGERDRSLATVQTMREGQFLASKVEEVAMKSGASNVKTLQRQSSGPPAQSSSPPLLSLAQPSITAARRPSASLQPNHHVLGMPYPNKKINPSIISYYRNGGEAAGFMGGGGGAIWGPVPIKAGGTTAAAAAAAEARRRRIEELKRSRLLQRSKSAPSRSAPRLTVSTLAL